MTVGRCTRCLGHKKASYMGGIYVNCQLCNGTGIMTIPDITHNLPLETFTPYCHTVIELDNAEILHTEIKPQLTDESNKILINSIPEIKAKDDIAFNSLISKSQAKRIEIQASDNKLDKRSKAYRDQKLKEALENE